MKYAYFPGCSAESTARDMHAVHYWPWPRRWASSWSSPRAGPAAGPRRAIRRTASWPRPCRRRRLAKVKDMGLDMVVNCAACYNRMKVANHEIACEQQVRAKVAEALGRDYDGSVKVRHFLEVLLDDVGTEASKGPCSSSLDGHEGGVLLRLPAGPAATR